MTFQLKLAVCIAAGSIACSDDSSSDTPVIPGDDTNDGDNQDVSKNPACTAAIAALTEELGDQLPAPYSDPTEMVGTGDQRLEADFAGKYRNDLNEHVGCEPRNAYGANVEFLVLDNDAEVPEGNPLSIDGYPCAAKAYTTANVDTQKPIVILVHGNSSSVTTWEEYASSTASGTEAQTLSEFTFTIETTTREMLATKLIDAGYEVIAFDARTDLVEQLADYNVDQTSGNPSRNIDHGWTVPMLQALIKAVMMNNPEQKLSLVGHSLGATVIRDALRRLYIEHKSNSNIINPFSRISDVILASGALHGVSTFGLCAVFPNQMRGTVACEMGDRGSFSPTYFSAVNNGPSDIYATPCADGSYAFGEEGQCEDNVVEYTTITMEDVSGGNLQDEFVSEAAAGISVEECVANELVSLSDYDRSGYFFTGLYGFLANHFGSIRSDVGMDIILDKLEN